MNKGVLIVIPVVIIILLAGYFLFFNQSSNDIYSGETSSLILDSSEIPTGWTIDDQGLKDKSEISQAGLDSGWADGYYAKYLSESKETTLKIAVARYPRKNLPSLFENPMEINGYTIEKLEDPSIGEQSTATKYTDKDGNNIYELSFYKKDIYVSLFELGTTDYEEMKNLAKKTASKID